jgi:hypothetical protein
LSIQQDTSYWEKQDRSRRKAGQAGQAGQAGRQAGKEGRIKKKRIVPIKVSSNNTKFSKINNTTEYKVFIEAAREKRRQEPTIKAVQVAKEKAEAEKEAAEKVAKSEAALLRTALRTVCSLANGLRSALRADIDP